MSQGFHMEIDLNSNGRNDEEAEMATLNKSSICMELWHACAGPLISLPKKGSRVVYFPEGHIEQLGSSFKQQQKLPFCSASSSPYDLPPPQIFCRVLNVNLLADQETDEVFAQVTLVPEPEPPGEEFEDDGNEDGSGVVKPMLHMFCKTLTASDTSTHGGFSVPRRAAEDCFPPLDYIQQRPSQELIAKDLHGVEWKFRHIYRGQPRRHLLTTGWSVFVSHKGLVSGDAVLFLRGENGELRLGIRRNSTKPTALPSSVVSNHNVHLSVVAAAANAVATKSMFHIFYNPRTSPAEFIVPYSRYVKGSKQTLSVGTRFRMRFESDDTAEKRYTGTITAIEDADPVKWPGSKWKSLKVEWDEHAMNERQDRVSPWEIESCIAITGGNISSSTRSKRLRSTLPTAVDTAASDVGRLSDFGESVKFSKVLQGQENMSFKAPRNGASPLRSPFLDSKGFNAVLKGFKRARTENEIWSLQRGSDTTSFVDFGESVRFQKVLQGQEISPLKASPCFGVESGKQPCNFSDDSQKMLERALIDNGSWISSGRTIFSGAVNASTITNGSFERRYRSQKLNHSGYSSSEKVNSLMEPFSNGNKSDQKSNNELINQSNLLSMPTFQKSPSKTSTSMGPSLLHPTLTESSAICEPGNVPSWGKNKLNSNMNSFYFQTTKSSEGLAEFEFPKRGFEWRDSMVLPGKPVNVQSDLCKSNLPQNNYLERDTEMIEMSPRQTQPCATGTRSMETQKTVKQSCKLFGISLTEESPPYLVAMPDPLKTETERQGSSCDQIFVSNQRKTADISSVSATQQAQSKGSARKCTKVHKQGSVVGRAIDLSKLHGYEQLICELERLFNMEGLLRSPDKGWQVVYTDNENDVMLVGDDPWQEFCNIVCKILIYTHDEVEKLRPGMFTDDAVSCSDEQPTVVEISKSCSGHQDSS